MLIKLLSLLLAVALVLLDQLVKGWATAVLMPAGQMPLLPGVVQLRYVVNDGMAFSLLRGRQALLIVVTGAVLLAVLLWLLLGRQSLLERLAWTLVLGGGVGNLIDRVLSGQVVDCFDLLFMQFPVFNVADICVCTGVGLLVLALLLEWRAERRAPPPQPDMPDIEPLEDPPPAGEDPRGIT